MPSNNPNPFKSDSTWVAQHMLQALRKGGYLYAGLTLKEFEDILNDALEHAHPESEKYGGYVLYVP